MNRINKIFIMDSAHRKIGSFAQGFFEKGLLAVGNIAPRISTEMEEEDLSSYHALHSLILRPADEPNHTVGLVSKTAAAAARIGVYGVFCAGLSKFPIPLELWPPALLVAVASWGSSHWTDYILIDFIRSARSRNPQKDLAIFQGEEKAGMVKSLLSFECHEEIHWAYRESKGLFYACAACLLLIYGYVLNIRPPVAQILLNQYKAIWENSFYRLDAGLEKAAEKLSISQQSHHHCGFNIFC